MASLGKKMNSGIFFTHKNILIALSTLPHYISHATLNAEMYNRFKNPLLKSFVIVSKHQLEKQVNIWKRHLPYVTPYYAIKSNNDPVLMSWMTELFEGKIGFDCASINEMETTRKVSRQSDIIYAQPCKTQHDIQIAKRHGVSATVVDSPEEMEKVGKGNWQSDVYIRLLVPDENSRQPFSKKFGAPVSWVPEILAVAKQYKMKVKGLSFHVGSECENPDQFSRALKVCREAMDIGKNLNTNMDTIDIGGGFLPTETNLSMVAKALEHSHTKYFPRNESPNGTPIRWIAEPGRFLSSTSQFLFTPVIGRKRGIPSPEPDAPEYRYTINESVYGYFSNVPFDGQKPLIELAHLKSTEKSPLFRSILFGRTCDGADIIVQNAELPKLEEGDWLKIAQMGAYTNVTASEFNGFPKPDVLYLK